MKYKKKLANLKAAQAWWDKLPERDKAGVSRPGGINQRTAASAEAYEKGSCCNWNIFWNYMT